jgi:hypothetical protein
MVRLQEMPAAETIGTREHVQQAKALKFVIAEGVQLFLVQRDAAASDVVCRRLDYTEIGGDKSGRARADACCRDRAGNVLPPSSDGDDRTV